MKLNTSRNRPVPTHTCSLDLFKRDQASPIDWCKIADLHKTQSTDSKKKKKIKDSQMPKMALKSITEKR